jgi:hypothetical protein
MEIEPERHFGQFIDYTSNRKRRERKNLWGKP